MKSQPSSTGCSVKTFGDMTFDECAASVSRAMETVKQLAQGNEMRLQALRILAYTVVDTAVKYANILLLKHEPVQPEALEHLRQMAEETVQLLTDGSLQEWVRDVSLRTLLCNTREELEAIMRPRAV